MRRNPLLLVLAICLISCKGTEARSAPQEALRDAPPYDIAPLAAMLRPGVPAEVLRRLGVGQLTDLPFYDLELTVDPAAARLTGRYTLYYRNTTERALPLLPLLLHPNAPRELGAGADTSLLELKGARTRRGPAVKGTRQRRLTLVEVELESPLAPGARLELEVTFEGSLRRLPADSNDIFQQALSSLGMSSSGMAASDYGLLAQGDGIVTLASAYPMLAPFHDGAFDTAPPTRFGDLAYNQLCHFRAKVSVPDGYTVVTNLLEGAPRTAGGRRTVVAAGAANRDLVVVAGAALQQKSRKIGQVTVRSTYLATDEKGGKRVLDAAVGSLQLFQERFGPYPYRELDVAEATLVGGAGGVEFPGMVLVAGMLYRTPSGSSSPLGQVMKLLGGLGNLLGGAATAGRPGGMEAMDEMVGQMAVFTTAHEVAHQYFAGLVGSDCRAQPALDEPLAQFAAGEYMRQSLGAAEGERLFDTNTKLNYAVYRLVGGADLPVARPVSEFPSALAYAAIVYGKAPYFYAALERQLGRERFRRALRRAVDEHRYQLITLDQWVRTLEKTAGTTPGELGPLARRWFHESHGDEDLGVDESGDQVLAAMMGKDMLAELKQSLALLGMQPKDLFKMLMGNMAP